MGVLDPSDDRMVELAQEVCDWVLSTWRRSRTQRFMAALSPARANGPIDSCGPAVVGTAGEREIGIASPSWRGR